ncbi:MAG: FAD-binding oxidoreductase [Gordonia sp. (in: high G+C Gram-positive bacteria)]
MTSEYDRAAVGQQLLAAGIARVLTPGDAGFDEVLAGFNQRVRHRPDAVVVARDEDDVVRAVRVAATLGTPVTAIGHGHGFRTGADGGIAIAVPSLGRVVVDAGERTATVGAAACWEEVLAAASAVGLAPLCGSSAGIGVVGYLLGGGLGPVARTYGFAADHVRSLRVVTGHGEAVVASPDSHTDLFWALRGGKGGLGVVTEVVIDLFPLPFVQGGGFFFDAADACAVVRVFSDWTQSLPESVTTSLALLRVPQLPEIPESIRGRAVVHVRIVVVGDEATAAELVAPIRTAASPLIDCFGAMPYAAIGTVHKDPVEPMPVFDGGRLLRSFGRDTVEALLEVAGLEQPVPLAAVEVRLLGGALARRPTVPNAVGGRDAAYSLHLVGAPVPELLDALVPAAIDAVFAAVAPWSAGGVQVNFFGAANRPEDLAASWPDDVAARLRQVRDAYDPRGLFPFAGHGS